MKAQNKLLSLLLPLMLANVGTHAQMILHRSPYQVEFGPALYIMSEDAGWGVGGAASFALGDSANPRHFVGFSFDYIADDYRYADIYQHYEDNLMFLFRYKWYTPDLASGRLQPYLGFGAGNTVVNYEERPATPSFSDGKDSINPTFTFDAGADLALTSWFALNLRYSAIGVFDIDRFEGNLVTENDFLHGFRFGTRISW